jgi:Glycogen debranching enzyme
MAYLKFNKEELVNLEYSLQREILLSNKSGGYVNTTIVGCNTRKYHGLLVVPISEFGGEKHVLLSSLHESLIQHGQSFNLGINSYGDVYEPRGHKYIIDFEMDYASTITYSVGGMKFTKTILFVRSNDELLIKYTLVDAHSPTTLRIKPFLAFRNIHSLTYANTVANTRYTQVTNGVAFRMYDGFPMLYLQLNKKNDWIASPDWYRGITYKEESRRGFADNEDLFVPGYFEIPIKKGESIILSASTNLNAPRLLKSRFDKEIIKRDGSRNDYDSCLKLAAKQFVICNNNEYSVCSGYTWDYEDLRSTFISIAGLTLYAWNDTEKFEKVIDNAISKFPKLIENGRQPDVPLWFIRSLQQYIEFGADPKYVWQRYGKEIIKVISYYVNGAIKEALLHENGLLWAKREGVALTWMNVYNNGKPITERGGYQVEVNALWYNALCFAVEMEERYGNNKIELDKWKIIIEKIRNNYFNIFWSDERKHLADYVDEYGKNIFTRPNQLIACAVKYSPISDEAKMSILMSVKKELLTPRGIRSLSPKNPLYKGVYEGNQQDRDFAHHNGCAFPFLLGVYIESMLRLVGNDYKNDYIREGKELLAAFEEDMTIHGIGSVSELYDGNPSHRPHGCISYAASIAEIIRLKYIIKRRNLK